MIASDETSFSPTKDNVVSICKWVSRKVWDVDFLALELLWIIDYLHHHLASVSINFNCRNPTKLIMTRYLRFVH